MKNTILSNWTAATTEQIQNISAELEYEATCDCAEPYGYDDDEAEDEEYEDED